MVYGFFTSIIYKLLIILVKYTKRQILIVAHAENYKVYGYYNYSDITEASGFEIITAFGVVLFCIFRIY